MNLIERGYDMSVGATQLVILKPSDTSPQVKERTRTCFNVESPPQKNHSITVERIKAALKEEGFLIN